MRRARRVYGGLLRRAARIVDRLAPGAVAAAATILRNVADQTSPGGRFWLQYAGARFQLDVVEERPFWYQTFSRWAAGMEVYELTMIECLTRLVLRTEAPRFVDIGAFMGHYACYVAALTGDQSEVYAIESNRRYCAAIERSVRLNGLSKLKVYNAVLSDRVEVAAIDEQEVRFDASGKHSARTTTLDELCRQETIRPVIAKIDVHGTEGKVLMGMQHLMKDSVDFVLLELHSEDWLHRYSGGMSRADVLGIFERAGFHLFYVAGHRSSGSPERQQTMSADALTYRRVTSQSSDLLLFDRPDDVLLLGSKVADVEPLLRPRTD
ncbi:MAG: FkbM family methyltransferase [Deltaproteobacteria bacterium]|nr:FkbM family methyltransferase [Deltaproteobacteria bacterium]MBI3388198.1 FkbM family methyltransferase [Deltaproteobacteria bacterium]